MAINFWEAQKRARSKTKIYLTIFILLTLSIAVVVEFSMRYFAAESYDPPFPILGFIFLAITFSVALFEYSMYKSYGGSYVALSVGAHLINKNTSNFKERQLLNIVEEMALASSLPIPPVYILPSQSINAFAAGITPQNAAIAITSASLDLLSREELQGVVAHEFGHIYNGDMKISMRLAAMVMGFFFVLYIAIRLLQFAPNDRERKGANPIVIASLILLAAGTLTWLCGSILKAAVSREREYLADACAVQFTRNPDGITNALKKLEKYSDVEDMPTKGMAYSHLYFEDNISLSSIFATHPPLRKRIAALEGREYIPAEWDIDKPQKNPNA